MTKTDTGVKSAGKKIMDESLPQILDELEQAIKDAHAASDEAKSFAQEARVFSAKAKDAANDVVRSEIEKLLPRITEAQGTAGQAMKAAKAAQVTADGALANGKSLAETMKTLAGLIDLARKEVRALATALLGSYREAQRFIASRVDFVTLETDESKGEDKTDEPL
jgi:ABC-type transporter Mla subunit MlaD